MEMDWYKWIMLAIALYAAGIKTLEHFGRRLPDVGRFFAKRWRAFVFIAYIIFASAYSLFFIVYVYALAKVELNIEIWTLTVLMLWSILGIWMPALGRFRNQKLIKRITSIFHIVFGGLLIVLFWIIKWPDWRTPSIITAFILFSFVLLLTIYLIDKRRRTVRHEIS